MVKNKENGLASIIFQEIKANQSNKKDNKRISHYNLFYLISFFQSKSLTSFVHKSLTWKIFIILTRPICTVKKCSSDLAPASTVGVRQHDDCSL